ncbi:MAG: PAS domain-containing sensor histidine kinase [Gammaproteobacteria bacterium]
MQVTCNIDHLNIPAIVLRTDHSVRAMNSLAAQLHGVELSTILDEDYVSFCQTHQLDETFVKEAADKITSENSITVIAQYRLDALPRYIEWTISGLYTGTQHDGFLLLGKDITQGEINTDNLQYLSKVAQDIIGRAVSPRTTVKEYVDDIVFHLDNIIAQMPGSVYWKDMHGCYLGGNNALVKLSGMTSVKDFIGKRDTYLGKKLGWPDELVNTWAEDDRRVSAGEMIINQEEPPFNTASGEVYHQLTNKVPLHNRDGKIIGILGISVDITDRKRAEKLAQEKMVAANTIANLKTIIEKFTGNIPPEQGDIQSYVEELDNYFRNIIRDLPGIIYWKDRNGVYLGCNQNTLNLIGAQPVDELIGKTDYDIAEKLGMEKYVPEKFIRDDKQVMDTGEPLLNQEEPPFRTASGDEIFELTNRTPLKNSAGKVIGILGVCIDITDKKRAEKLEQERQAQEKEILKKINTFLKTAAGSIAHELKNPLSGVSMQISMLEALAQQQYWRDQESSLSEEESLALKMKTPIEVIRERLAYANNFISMQLANMGADSIDTSKFSTCSISHCVQEALSHYSFEVPEHEALVHWQGGKDFNFHGDERLAKHVLWNLLNNALHYIKIEKKGKITLWLEDDADNNYLYFKDTAKGMPAGMAAKVFDQFYSKRHGGTGLGLSLCQMAMQAFGGDITCQAEEDQYAQFILRFPRKK